MTLSLDEYRNKLINKILFACSQEEVRRFCHAAMKGLEQHKVNGHIATRFADKIIKELEQFDPVNKNAQQWSNIKMAKIEINRIKQQIIATAN
ncbi:MAG: hypothetical protein ACM3H8_06155 [Sphingobacteriales bacterium]